MQSMTIETDLAILRDQSAHGYVRVKVSRVLDETDAQRKRRELLKLPPTMVEYMSVMKRENAEGL